ncbi:hypothetical protein PR048_031167 [Dryococelus australis]|uniref:Uncharacterized protein n=1 Tax=Dryococelus australis TaxID=614101 RepID=A0ABQ9G4H9_9NEOP|nr:hypothetical protein PR048_031167 [Dryococelus australis]
MDLLHLAHSLTHLETVRKQCGLGSRKTNVSVLGQVNHRRSTRGDVKRYASKQTAEEPRRRRKTPVSDGSISDGVFSLRDSTSEDTVIADSETDIIPNITSSSLSDMLRTPEAPATINYRAKKVVASPFQSKILIETTEESLVKLCRKTTKTSGVCGKKRSQKKTAVRKENRINSSKKGETE